MRVSMDLINFLKRHGDEMKNDMTKSIEELSRRNAYWIKMAVHHFTNNQVELNIALAYITYPIQLKLMELTIKGEKLTGLLDMGIPGMVKQELSKASVEKLLNINFSWEKHTCKGTLYQGTLEAYADGSGVYHCKHCEKRVFQSIFGAVIITKEQHDQILGNQRGKLNDASE